MIKLPENTLKDAGFYVNELPKLKLYEANGCKQCHQGYKGRTGIYEVLPVTQEIAAMILDHAKVADITAQATRQGYISLREAGLDKVRTGITSLTEINRVTLA